MIYITKMTRDERHPGYSYFAYLGADSLDELHTFAKRLGLPEHHFRQIDERMFYYLITDYRRHKNALRLGALQSSSAKFMRG